MAVITINHMGRTTGADEERTVIGGHITFGGRQTAYPSGSFRLRTLTELHLFPRGPQGVKRGAYGSVSSPNIIGNTVNLFQYILGTTGTRLASIATIGSVAPSGTQAFNFLAYGW